MNFKKSDSLFRGLKLEKTYAIITYFLFFFSLFFFYSWYYIDSMKSVDELQVALSVRGIREAELKKAISRNYNNIKQSVELMNK